LTEHVGDKDLSDQGEGKTSKLKGGPFRVSLNFFINLPPMNLVDNLIQEGWLKTSSIIQAFRKIKRKDFLPFGIENLAEINEALSIGYYQTISQPLVVALMLELLQPQKGEKILDIGSGSGWTTALLSEIVKPRGRVFALEIVPELKKFGEGNARKYSFIKKGIAKFILADGSKGYPEAAPFDKILCSASLQKNEFPKSWQKQLKPGGRIVAPLGNSIYLCVKKANGDFESEEFPGFVFVPLVKNKKLVKLDELDKKK